MSSKDVSQISPERCSGKESRPVGEKKDHSFFASRILSICSDISYTPIDECHRDQRKTFIEVKGSGTVVKDENSHASWDNYIKEDSEEESEAASESVEDAADDMIEVGFESDEQNVTNQSDFRDIVDFMGSDTSLTDGTESAVGAAAREIEYRRGQGRDSSPQILSNIPSYSIDSSFVPDNEESEPGAASPSTLGMDRSTALQQLEHNADENVGAIARENDSQEYPEIQFVAEDAPIHRVLRPRIRTQSASLNEPLAESGEETSEEDVFIEAVDTGLSPSGTSLESLGRNQSKNYTCTYCGKQLSRNDHMARHLRTHTGEKPFPCPICEKRFACTTYLTVHLRTHTGEKPYPCTLCEKSFPRPDSLNTHIRRHMGEKPYECNFCRRRFITRYGLDRHTYTHTRTRTRTRTHTGEKPFGCTVCDKHFRDHNTLVVHTRTHTGERPYPCTLCEKQFVRSCALNVHMFTHTKERPHECVVCEKRFAHKGHLSRHMRCHTGAKPYKCTVCARDFSLNSGLRRHMGVHTEETSFE